MHANGSNGRQRNQYPSPSKSQGGMHHRNVQPQVHVRGLEPVTNRPEEHHGHARAQLARNRAAPRNNIREMAIIFIALNTTINLVLTIMLLQRI